MSRPYKVGVTFNQDMLPGLDGTPEKYLILNHVTPKDRFWLAFNADNLAEYLEEILGEVANMRNGYTDVVMTRANNALTRYKEDANRRIDAALTNRGAATEGEQPLF